MLRAALRPLLGLRNPAIYSRRAFVSGRTIPPMALSPLNYASGPLVWVDCEMTGLNHKTDKILEIAVSGRVELLACWCSL